VVVVDVDVVVVDVVVVDVVVVGVGADPFVQAVARTPTVTAPVAANARVNGLILIGSLHGSPSGSDASPGVRRPRQPP
jgi:hypothetical protein